MSPKDRYEKLRKEAFKPLPTWQQVWRKAYIDALKSVMKREEVRK